MKNWQIKLISIILLMIVVSCKKDQQSIQNLDGVPSLTLGDVKNWYAKNVVKSEAEKFSEASSSAFEKKAFSLSSLQFAWDKMRSISNKTGNYWLVNLKGQPTFQNVKQGYRKLVFVKDSNGNIQPRILEIIPDAIYSQRKQYVSKIDFTGRVFIYDDNYQLLNGLVYANAKIMGKIKPLKVSSSITNSLNSVPSKPSNISKVAMQIDCEWFEDSYIDGDGELTIFAEYDCAASMFDDGVGGGIDYVGSTDNGDAGGGTSSGSEAVTQPSNLPDESKGGISSKSYMDCFGNITDPNAKMSVTVYVQEPWPGTSFNVGPNSVGHVAIGLSKSTGSTSITQVVGFYPNATGYSKLHAPSKVVDNGGDLNYNVSISYSVSASQFNQIINYVANPPSTYDLNTFNCTNFVYNACQAGGITLPDPTGVVGLNGATMSLDKAMTPAHLGGSIEDLKGQSNVNTTGGYTPNSKGPCN